MRGRRKGKGERRRMVCELLLPPLHGYLRLLSTATTNLVIGLLANWWTLRSHFELLLVALCTCAKGKVIGRAHLSSLLPICLSDYQFSRSRSPNCYLLYNKCARSGCHFWLSCITVIGTSSPRVSSCMKILLTLHMRPTPIALNYSVELQHQAYTERRMTENNTYMKNCNRTQ